MQDLTIRLGSYRKSVGDSNDLRRHGATQTAQEKGRDAVPAAEPFSSGAPAQPAYLPGSTAGDLGSLPSLSRSPKVGDFLSLGFDGSFSTVSRALMTFSSVFL